MQLFENRMCLYQDDMCLNVLSLLVFTKCCICLIHAVLYIIANSLMMPIDHIQLHLIYTVFLQTTRSTSCCSHIQQLCSGVNLFGEKSMKAANNCQMPFAQSILSNYLVIRENVTLLLSQELLAAKGDKQGHQIHALPCYY